MCVGEPGALKLPEQALLAAEDFLIPVDEEIAPLPGWNERPFPLDLHLKLDAHALVTVDRTVLLGEIDAGAICPHWPRHRVLW